jgi:hypothetical protein
MVHGPSSSIVRRPSVVRRPSSVVRRPSSVVRRPSSVFLSLLLLLSFLYRLLRLSRILSHPMPSSFLYQRVMSYLRVVKPIAIYYHSVWTNHANASVNGFFRSCPLFQTHRHVRVGFSEYKLLIHTDNPFLLHFFKARSLQYAASYTPILRKDELHIVGITKNHIVTLWSIQVLVVGHPCKMDVVPDNFS